MLPNFTGTTRQRRINLGGASTAPLSVAETLLQARLARESRLAERQRAEAVMRIWRWWGNITAREKATKLLREEFDRDNGSDLLRWTRLLVFGARIGRCKKANKDELGLVGRWCRFVVGSDAGKMRLQTFIESPDTGTSAAVLLTMIGRWMAYQISFSPSSTQIPLYVEILKLLPSPLLASFSAILSTGLKSYLISRPPTILSVHTLALHLNLFEYATSILTLSPDNYLERLKAEKRRLIPLTSLLAQVSSTSLANSMNSSESRLNFLANILILAGPSFEPSKMVAKSTIAGVLDCFTLLERGGITLGPKDEEIAMSLDQDGDIEMGDSVPTQNASQSISLSTISVLQTIPSRMHGLLTHSTRYPTLLPSLCRALSTLLHLTTPSARIELLNALIYSPSSSSPSSSTSDKGKCGNGLICILWREVLRPSVVGRDHRAVVRSLNTEDWTGFILLSEAYAKLLLTMTDDEFHGFMNPLSLDEVRELVERLRNVAFALWWEDLPPTFPLVKGSGWSVFEIRDLATRLLRALHARDSRRNFVDREDWYMVEQTESGNFIQSVMYEAEKEAEEEDRENGLQGEDHFYHGRLGFLRRRRQKWGSKFGHRQKSVFSPRLGVLNNIPFVIPFELRVAIFRQFVASDRMKHGYGDYSFRSSEIPIRRNKVAEDGYARLNHLGPHWKGTVRIKFFDEFGHEEAGIDGGGLYKEFLTSLSKETFDSNRGLWLETKQHELYPNPHSYAQEDFQLSWFTFLGRILGKALYDGILVDVNFANFFLSKWLGKQSHLDDLASLDPDLYQGLVNLKNYEGNVEKDLSLDFTIGDNEFGQTVTRDLIPNGSNIPVTNENRMEYIYRTSYYRLNTQIEPQCAAFLTGLSDLIDNRWLQMFNQSELKILVGGVEEDIDVDDLERNTVYHEPFTATHETIQMFWKAMRRFSKEEKKKLIKFVTSCPRPPLLGFSELNPKFAIRPNGDNTDRLPTASTCVNLLKLPMYKTQRQLTEKVTLAIDSNTGFGFS